MASRVCSNCGVQFFKDASFCVECGEQQAGATVRPAGRSFSWHRHAPLFVVLLVIVVAGGTVVAGRLAPKTRPQVPPRGMPNPGAGANLPENHPPIEIPEQVKRAIANLAAKAAAAPEDVEAWARLGGVQYRAGQIDRGYLSQAEASYRHVLERESDNLEALRTLGNIAFDQQQPGIAIDFYQRYLKLKPDDLNVQTDMATMYLAEGQSAEAMRLYKAVLQTDPSFFQAQFNLSIAYRSVGQTDAAIAALEKARAIAPDDATRTRLDQLLARAKNQPPSAAAGAIAPPPRPDGAADAAAPGPPTGTFQADLEVLLRTYPIMGPKVERIEWQGAQRAQLYLRDFPMQQMGEEMQTMFIERLRGKIKAQKEAHSVARTASVELIDAATGQVMGTITE